MARARRVGGFTSRPISRRISSTVTISLRILLCMVFLCTWFEGDSALAVPARDLGSLEPADARVDARTCAHGQDVDQLVRQRRTGYAYFHGVEIAAHVRRVDVRERDIQARARRADFLGRRHDRKRVTG